MLQRIQTVYLAIALVFIGLMGWLPLGEVAVNGEVYTFYVKGIINEATGEQLQAGLPIMAFLGIVIGLQIAIIFGFKKRVRQMRMATYNIILMLGVIGVAFVFKYLTFKDMGDVVNNHRIALVFPLVAAVLNYLAIRAIGKDEALVRSVDRIR